MWSGAPDKSGAPLLTSLTQYMVKVLSDKITYFSPYMLTLHPAKRG